MRLVSHELPPLDRLYRQRLFNLAGNRFSGQRRGRMRPTTVVLARRELDWATGREGAALRVGRGGSNKHAASCPGGTRVLDD